jgi:hypothetical protein
MDDHDPAVVGVLPPLDEAPLGHAIDDAGGARDGHVERVGESTHREGSIGLEDGQDVEVDEAQGSAQPEPERAGALLRAPRGQLVEQLVGDRGAVRHTRILQCHIDNLCHVYRSVNRLDQLRAAPPSVLGSGVK